VRAHAPSNLRICAPLGFPTCLLSGAGSRYNLRTATSLHERASRSACSSRQHRFTRPSHALRSDNARFHLPGVWLADAAWQVRCGRPNPGSLRATLELARRNPNQHPSTPRLIIAFAPRPFFRMGGKSPLENPGVWRFSTKSRREHWCASVLLAEFGFGSGGRSLGESIRRPCGAFSPSHPLSGALLGHLAHRVHWEARTASVSPTSL
jgi:hypothetical protein